MSPPRDDVYANIWELQIKIRELGAVSVRKVYYQHLSLSIEKWAG
jgi:hypothetical protein